MKTRSQRLLEIVDEVAGPGFRANLRATRHASAHRDNTPPDSYRVADDNRKPTQADVTPDIDPRYKPYGQPPDGYALALALRKLKEDE